MFRTSASKRASKGDSGALAFSQHGVTERAQCRAPSVPDERLNRALTAFLRQEVQAPATAVTDFLDMIIEDARGCKLDACSPISTACAAPACS